MPAEQAAGPLFVGGTGRSGTTIVGQLLGARQDLAYIPVELRFHVDRGGLADLGAGRVTVQEFIQRMRTTWFIRRPRNGPRGLHVIATRPEMRAGFRALRQRYGDDPWDGCGAFMEQVIRPWCEREHAQSWVEMTPPNASAADALCRMFPASRVVHVVRDGRDVAASVARRGWGPDTIDDALVWWADRLIEIDAAERRADPARVLKVRLEALVGTRREQEFERLVRFIGRPPDAGMRAFFDEQMSIGASRPGSWRVDLDETSQAEIQKLYEAQLRRLDEHRVTIPPP